MPKTSCSRLLLLALLFGFGSMAGCQGSVNTVGIRPEALEPKPVVESSRENLSMAKELRNVPATEYLLGPGDSVDVSVFGHDELRMEGTVSPSGKLSYYLLGDIHAAGLTQFQLRDKIQRGLSTYIKVPHVVVRITEHVSHKVYLLGELKNPGVYRMRHNFTLVEAISEAGGVTSDAYLSGAYVVRDEQVLLINFYELIEKGNAKENIPLMPDDVIYIPDNRDQKVFVLGEVNRQAAIPMQDGLSLLGAIAEAGGFTRDAKKDSIVVLRGSLSTPEIIEINGENPAFAGTVPLERGDIIYVAASSFANAERVAVRIANILRPFYDLARTIVWGDAAIGVVFEDKDSNIVVDRD